LYGVNYTHEETRAIDDIALSSKEDADAMNLLTETLLPFFRWIAGKFTGRASIHDPDDLAHEAVLKLPRFVSLWNPETCSFVPYIYCRAASLMGQLVRRDGRVMQRSCDGLQGNAMSYNAVEELDAVAGMSLPEVVVEDRLVLPIPETDRTFLEMYYFEGLSWGEIGKKVGKSKQYCHASGMRAIDKLRRVFCEQRAYRLAEA
jgi:RNA polymerase sigma factor (sigma-70 family)